MYLSRENITNRIKEIPMAIVMLLFALGISFAEYIYLPMWLCITIVLFSLVGALFVRGAWQRLAVAILVVSLGVTLHSLSYTGAVPYNRPLDMTLKITRSTTLRGDYAGAEATICECEEPSLVGRKVVVWSDTLTAFTARDHISLRQKISPFREERRAYAELMHHRGFVGAITIYPQQHFTLIPARYTSLHDWATERLREQMPAGDARAVVLAMVTGYRGEISSALRERYALSGASHLLAVSGLHIGIVFMLINILLLPMLLLTYGNVARSVVAVLLIWLYVLLCGAPPSAIRAAVMFSLLQIALSTPYRYLSLNILAGTALVMTMFDTHLLFDISFQLSFLAVAGILLWAVPASRLLKTPYRIVNGVVAVLLVGVASTVATLPMVSENFGVVSLVGVIINPIVIVLANILVVLGAITMLIPMPIVASVVEWVAHLQNVVVEWAQSLPWGCFEYKMSEWLVWLIYLVFAGITIFVWSIKRERRSEIADY
jgi:competence protein ComEC